MYSAELESIKDQCTLCKKCPCYQERLNIVFGDGNEKADILFVGDFPRGKDDLKGIPFTGDEGEILHKFLTLCDIDEDKIFLTNILKCRPEEEGVPEDSHFDTCMEHLRNQVRFIKPKIIVCLGETASRKMIDPALNLDKEHGKFVKKGKLYFLSTYHPSDIISDGKRKTAFLGDFQTLREFAEKGGVL